MNENGHGGNGNGAGGGQATVPTACVLDGRLDEDAQLAALNGAHDFPGLFPVVVIARPADGFESRLEDALERMQGGAGYSVRKRASRHGNYLSFRLELHVGDAREALARRSALAALPGVVMLL